MRQLISSKEVLTCTHNGNWPLTLSGISSLNAHTYYWVERQVKLPCKCKTSTYLLSVHVKQCLQSCFCTGSKKWVNSPKSTDSLTGGQKNALALTIINLANAGRPSPCVGRITTPIPRPIVSARYYAMANRPLQKHIILFPT